MARAWAWEQNSAMILDGISLRLHTHWGTHAPRPVQPCYQGRRGSETLQACPLAGRWLHGCGGRQKTSGQRQRSLLLTAAEYHPSHPLPEASPPQGNGKAGEVIHWGFHFRERALSLGVPDLLLLNTLIVLKYTSHKIYSFSLFGAPSSKAPHLL